jgi:hypothetical protein
MVDQIRGMPEVKYVERNQEVHALQACLLQSGATWGLVRTTLEDWDTNPNDPPNEYSHDKNGKCIITSFLISLSPFSLPPSRLLPIPSPTHTEGNGVTVYIIDT